MLEWDITHGGLIHIKENWILFPILWVCVLKVSSSPEWDMTFSASFLLDCNPLLMELMIHAFCLFVYGSISVISRFRFASRGLIPADQFLSASYKSASMTKKKRLRQDKVMCVENALEDYTVI